MNTKWNPKAVTILEGLQYPRGLTIDDENGFIYVADTDNHRVIRTKMTETKGHIVAGGNDQGNGLHQLNRPSDVLIDEEQYAIIICDQWNERVMSWSLREGTTQGVKVIDNIWAHGLTMDDKGTLYVTDITRDEIRRYQRGDIIGEKVAGGNGRGNRLDQLSFPAYVVVDEQETLYISDFQNHRVMKWLKGATEGIVMIGIGGRGTELSKIDSPRGLVMDKVGTLYLVEGGNGRVTRWKKGALKGELLVGELSSGSSDTKLNRPIGLAFDAEGNIFVADNNNHRVQRFSIVKNL